MSTSYTMDQLKLRRSAVDGKLKRSAYRVSKFDAGAVSIDDLNAELDHLHLLWQDFREVHSGILDLCTDTESIEPHLDEEAALERRYLSLKASINQTVRTVAIRDNPTPPLVPGQSIIPAAGSTATLVPPELHLPKGILPTFSGDYGEWNSFYDLFISSVHNNPRLTNAQRLFYLKTYTTGRAAALLKYIKVEDNAYEGALDILKKRFDRKDQIVNHHIQRFCEIPSTTVPSVSGLRKLHETADDVKRALQAIEREDRDCWLVYLLLAKVDSETRQQWSDKFATNQDPPKFEDFLEFLEQRTYSLETAQTQTPKSTMRHVIRPQPRSSSFVTTNEQAKNPSKCSVCNEAPHRLYYCKRFQEIPVAERIRLVNQLGLCKNCLCASHGKASCTAGDCRKCKQRHHTLLHEGPSLDSVPAKGSQLSFGVINQLSYGDCFTSVFLATAVVNLVDSSGQQHSARALLDSASQANFITAKLSKRLGLKTHRINLPLKGISGLTTKITEAIEVDIQSRTSDYEVRIDCAVLPKIYDPIPHQFADISDWELHPSKPLADDRFNIPGEVDLLLGASVFYNLLHSDRMSLGPAKPVLQETALGWVVAGLYESKNSALQAPLCFVSHVDPEDEPSLSQLVSKFWEIEDFKPSQHLTKEEQFCEELYTQTTVRDASGRYIVKLPFIRDPTAIGETGYSVLAQFTAMQRQLQRDPEKYVLYHKYVEEFLENNHITRIAPDPNHPKIIYLAHHGVIKAESSTTKLRVVFNAAKKSSNGLSLNDLLATGPIVQDTLYNLLMNFRLYPVVLTADLTKMFLQVKVTEEDSERIRILWQEFGQPMAEYGLNTVTFGMSCAPFLATRTLNQLGEDEGTEFPLAKEAIKDFYVDDLLTGAATREEAKQKRQQITEMMKRGGFEIRKWASNDREVLDDIPPEDRAVSVVHTVDSQETIKTLGVQWQHREDLFTFKASDDPIKECFTKREVLSTIAKIFDPLGLIGPIVVIAKMMMQELWKIQTDWSEPLPNQFNHRWRIYLVHLRNVWQIKVPRRCISVPQPVQYHLHGFCDASLEVYGAAVYLRAIDENGDISSHLLGSKSRVAPINRPSLPRLKLCAATLLAELIKAMKSTLRIPIHQTLAFSDSTTTLAWIAGDPARWKIYVSNRVATINTIIPASDWRHVPTKQNPADLLTHGVAPCVLALSKLWWHGPDWEPSTTTEAPIPNPTRKEEEVINTEVRRQQPILAYLMTYRDVIEDILHKYSSYTKLLRVTAWIIRFSENCQLERAQRTVGPLSVIEINAAKRLLIRYTQHQAYAAEISALEKCKPLPDRSKLLPLSPFVESNLLRVGGRLARSNLEYTAKHPLIIPAESRLATIIFNHEHLRNHHLGATSLLSAVRETFWVPHGRKLARNTIWKCVPCHKNAPNRGMLQQIMGQLPETRVTPAPPFFHCGVDYAGPITLVEKRTRGTPTIKGYIAIFVCFATKAVHLEAVSKLSTKAFLAAMRRFVARRGHCGHMYSDNGTNFVGADNEMRYWYRKISSSDHNNRVADFLAMGGTQWHFNPPGSPHMGGLWEAAVKSAKHHLNIVTQKARLTFEEFGTLLAEIESILNSRPISPASNDPNDLQPLTPGHFLIGRPLTAINEQDYLPSPDEPYDVRFRYVNELRQHFWDRWSKEYIPELQLKGKWHRTTNTLEEGDLVLRNGEVVCTGSRSDRIFIARDVVVEELALKQRIVDCGSEVPEAPVRSKNHGQLAGPSSSRSVADREESQQEESCPGGEEESDDKAEDRSFEKDRGAAEEGNGGAEAGLRRSERVRKPPAKLNDYLCITYALNAESYVENIPDTIEELQKLEDWPEWKLAIDEELNSLAENNTWQLVYLPAGRRAVDCKWVFRLKFGPDGSVLKRKARLMSTVRSMLALANQFDLDVHQMDVTSAFLNGILTEDIYMRQPKGFEEGDKVCTLNKSIYGLKQASTVWNDRFNEFISRCGFRRSEEDSCLYVQVGKSGPVYLLLYVDDVLIIVNNLDEVKTVKRMLRMEFKMQDLGEAQMFLGLRIDRDREKGVMKLSQLKYVDAVLRRFGMEECIYGATTAWSTRKQALSSTEAECYALADCICEVLWISKLFVELDIREHEPAEIFEDNQSTIAIAESDGSSKKLKHTEVKLHFIKECVQEGKVNLCYIPTADQPADILTKGLSPVPFTKHRIFMGIKT
ncbi:uncharacterized protein LOC135712910 [Ochlerotatus camptorhynchus]|uniref:uncharacterized protein LOC135712910 n=1 Tax=Ochlerotatus camptorhynchus TaxID=644619 RepID=UPI0031CF8B8F